MIRGEELAEFEAAGIHDVVAKAHDAEWARVASVVNERQVMGDRVLDQYLRVDCLVQNGHLIGTTYKISERYRGGFSEEQISLLGLKACAQPLVDRSV